MSTTHCTECSVFGVECSSAKAMLDCGCFRCTKATLASVREALKESERELKLAQGLAEQRRVEMNARGERIHRLEADLTKSLRDSQALAKKASSFEEDRNYNADLAHERGQRLLATEKDRDEAFAKLEKYRASIDLVARAWVSLDRMIEVAIGVLSTSRDASDNDKASRLKSRWTAMRDALSELL